MAGKKEVSPTTLAQTEIEAAMLEQSFGDPEMVAVALPEIPIRAYLAAHAPFSHSWTMDAAPPPMSEADMHQWRIDQLAKWAVAYADAVIGALGK